MIDDDELRRALRDAAPDAPDPAAARHRLAPAMTRARRRRRLRTTAGTLGLTLAVGLGGAAALDQLSSSDTTEIGPAGTLPAPRVGEPETPSSTPSAAPAPSSTIGPSDTGPTAASTASDTMPSDAMPSDTMPSDTMPSDTAPSDTAPSDTVPPAPPTSSTTPVVPAPATSVSGPHVTTCGSATFVHDGSTVQLADHEVVAGYRFRVESESPTQVEVKWDDGPSEECEIHAHLEGATLVVDGDHDDD